MTRFPADHPRVVAVSPALTASMRAAFWPRGVDSALLTVMERKANIKPPAPVAKATPKPAATTAAAKPTPPAQARAPAAKAAPPPPPVLTLEQRLGAAIETTIATFNQEYGQI